LSKIKKTALFSLIGIIALTLLFLFFPTWTPKIEGTHSINVLEQVKINGEQQQIMIRGKDVSNPIIIYVHGGPGASEIAYAKKYQDLLETNFTIVNYDQRGSGKSYHFFEDYASLSPDILVQDLLAVTDYISERLDQKKVILIGHSFGTYIATLAAQTAPEKYAAYIGIGQMADTLQSELESWDYVMEQARLANNLDDIKQLQDIYDSVKVGNAYTPRDLVAKYDGASRLIASPDSSFAALSFSSEYNGLDALRYNLGMMNNQPPLVKQVMSRPLPSLIAKMDLPIYFVMGKYDGMTSANVAKQFFDKIQSPDKKFILYEQSAHYPHYEEKQRFFDWMTNTFTD
jgi:pimeloyl-ACP methyl ester carboxylesterase